MLLTVRPRSVQRKVLTVVCAVGSEGCLRAKLTKCCARSERLALGVSELFVLTRHLLFGFPKMTSNEGSGVFGTGDHHAVCASAPYSLFVGTLLKIALKPYIRQHVRRT